MTRLLLLIFVPAALAQSVVVGTRAPDGKIAFEVIDDFQINQSRRIRLLPEQQGDVDPNTVRRLPHVDMAQAGLIRNDGSGRIVSLNGAGSRDIVLPDNYSPRGATPARDIPGPLTLTLVRNRRTHQTENIAPEAFFVVLFGAPADEVVADFVGKDWAFLNPNEQLAAMRGFVSSFASSPATRVFRDSLESRVSGGLDAFDNGGPYDDLLAARRFSELARQAFPGDGGLRALDEKIAGRIRFVTERPKLLRSLAALGDWDALLDKYRDFDAYESSFPDVQALHQEALEESARAHSLRARAFEQRADYGKALKEAKLALARDPGNREIRDLVEEETQLSTQIEAQGNASRRRILPKGLPADIRFSNALASAEQAITNKDFKKAQESIQDADRENPGAPEVILARARMLAAQNRNTEALGLLDQYDRVVTASAEREKGYEVRRQIMTVLDKNEDAMREQIAGLVRQGLYSKLDEALRDALRTNGEDAQFLYQGGVAAAVLKDGSRAFSLLNAFLARSNAIGVDPRQRSLARRVLAVLKKETAAPHAAGGLFYDPQSLSFLIPLDSVTASHVRMAFQWAGGRLDSIRTTFDDDRGAQLYRALVVAGAADSGAIAATTGAGQGNFFFGYQPSGALREVLATPVPPAPTPYAVHVIRDQGRIMLVDADGRPEVVPPDHPYVDTAVLAVVEGAPVTSVVAGNSFFNPFLWDGIHTFTVQYDSQGRAESAQEWNADNLVRFRWDGARLLSVHAFHKNSDTPYYQRTISYSGFNITGEDYSVNGRAGRIRYTYSSGKLQQITIENEGHEWVARPR